MVIKGEEKINNADDLVASSAAGATMLMFGQLFTKLMTFVINQLLIRFISSHIFGITSFMEVIISCALFYSREGIRLTCQRISSGDRDDRSDTGAKIMAESYLGTVQSIINMSIIPVLIGIPTTLLLLTQLPDLSSYDHYRLSTILLVISVVIELLSEPFYNLNQFKLRFKIRTKIESLSFLTKCASQFCIVNYFNKYHTNSGYYILAFITGHLVYTLTIFVSYLYDYKKSNYKHNSLIISKIYTDENTYQYFDKTLMNYWLSLLLQLLFKYLLTEGDRFLLSYLCSPDEQGIFALITNYGSLIARLLFAPVEETLRMVLTRSFSTNSKKSVLSKKVQLLSVLAKIFKFYAYLSLIIIIFAPLNSGFFLKQVIGEKWTSSNTLLFRTFKMYWLYIPFLAVNGIMEATFYSITDDPKKILNYSKVMVVCSISYFLILVFLIKYLQLSLVGLVLANIFNMSLRVIYCTKSISFFLATDNLNLFNILKDRNYVYALMSSFSVYILHIRVIGEEVTSFKAFLQSALLGFSLLTSFVIIERRLILEIFNTGLKRKID